LIDGSISACPNIDRTFSQGNIYKDNFLKFGKRDTNSSEIEPGQKPEDVKNVQNILLYRKWFA